MVVGQSLAELGSSGSSCLVGVRVMSFVVVWEMGLLALLGGGGGGRSGVYE